MNLVRNIFAMFVSVFVAAGAIGAFVCYIASMWYLFIIMFIPYIHDLNMHPYFKMVSYLFVGTITLLITLISIVVLFDDDTRSEVKKLVNGLVEK